MTRIRDLQRRTNDLFLAAGEAEARGDTGEGVRFSPFVPEHVVSRDAHCGSMSFCGVRDASYPDRRPMGYPFDRPLPPGTTLDDVVAGRPNMATRDLAIRFRGRL